MIEWFKLHSGHVFTVEYTELINADAKVWLKKIYIKCLDCGVSEQFRYL